MAIQVIPQRNFGEELGQRLGSGLSSGLQTLANIKLNHMMQDYQNNMQTQAWNKIPGMDPRLSQAIPNIPQNQFPQFWALFQQRLAAEEANKQQQPSGLNLVMNQMGQGQIPVQNQFTPQQEFAELTKQLQPQDWMQLLNIDQPGSTFKQQPSIEQLINQPKSIPNTVQQQSTKQTIPEQPIQPTPQTSQLTQGVLPQQPNISVGSAPVMDEFKKQYPEYASTVDFLQKGISGLGSTAKDVISELDEWLSSPTFAKNQLDKLVNKLYKSFYNYRRLK